MIRVVQILLILNGKPSTETEVKFWMGEEYTGDVLRESLRRGTVALDEQSGHYSLTPIGEHWLRRHGLL